MRAYVESYGCTLNKGEASEIQDMLLSRGWSLVSDPSGAELSILVTCVVIEATEKKMLKRLRALANSKRVIVTGCMATARMEAAKSVLPSAEFVAPGDLESIGAIAGHVGPPIEDKCGLEPPGFSIVPIATGCLGECSYCITRLARGSLRSRPMDEVVARVSEAVRDGPLEVRMTAQDAAAYGLDIGSDLVELVDAVTKIGGDHRIRLGMMNPDSVLPLLGRLLNRYLNSRVFKFLHLPVQSSSDKLLSAMGRRYSVADFEMIVSSFRSVVPELTLSTDIIVGFPGETEDDHDGNLELIERVQPDIVNLTRYSPRPGTAAFETGPSVVGWRAKERSRQLTETRFDVSRLRNERMIGRKTRALATERGKNDTTILRDDSYRQIVLHERLELRRFYEVVVDEATPTYLVGSLLAGNR